jgi:hypothetical protein
MEETKTNEKNLPTSGHESINKENNSVKFDSQTSENMTITSNKNQMSIQSPLMSKNLNKINSDKAPIKSDQKTEKSSDHRIIEKTENLSKYSEESGQFNSKKNLKYQFLNGNTLKMN